MKRSLFVQLRFSIGLSVLVLLSTSSLSAQSMNLDKDSPLTLYKNGHIYTNDSGAPWAAAMLVRGEEILAVGDEDEVVALAEKGTRIVDLEGRFVMPGFNDAHVHLGSAGQDALAVRLQGAATIDELQKRLMKALSQAKEGEWITGFGWDHTLWPEKRFPTRNDLDKVSPQNPVFLVHISGHVAVANSAALKVAGITATTPNPTGGEVEHDAKGAPDGMLKEGSAMSLVESKIPSPSNERRKKGIELALADVAANGVTSIQDNSLVDALGKGGSGSAGNDTWDDFRVYRELKSEGKLTVRITEWLPFAAPLERLEQMRREGGTTDPWLRTGALKMVTDGALGSRTAAMLAPYSDDVKTSGILTMEPEKLRSLAIERDKAGFQLNFHAIGDRANRVSLDVFEAVAKVNGPRDRRDRIEHAQVVALSDIPRFASLQVIASMQPSHQTTDMRWAESRVGPDRIKGAYAWARIQKFGARLAFGTDYDVEVISPFRGLYACVTRELPDGGPAGGWQPQEKISLGDCIRAYTSGSAYAEFEEGKKGELKAGEFADFIVLSDDLTKIPPSQYTKVKVILTIVGGRTVYSAER
ncbi:MAG TPA: amidohydrolase [Candidatus Sulfotelmatobacter sp.]|jgi:predicted amidohydrolase YtcJ|nr:amidohydrolase [Candidatus Sulfotelmatobacter sp.]